MVLPPKARYLAPSRAWRSDSTAARVRRGFAPTHVTAYAQWYERSDGIHSAENSVRSIW